MPNEPAPEELFKPMGKWARRCLGLYLLAAIPLLIVAVGSVWTSALGLAGADPGGEELKRRTQELSLVQAVALLGALGGSLHALKSFAVFVGNRNLVRSWVWWYTARAPVGAALAFIVYLGIRGGLMGVGNNGIEGVNGYGVGALAFLSGLFSEVATDKLKEVFVALFRPSETKKDAVGDAGPIVGKVEPDRLAAGTGDQEVTVTGEGFSPTDLVLLGGVELKTSFVSATELKAVIPAAQLKTAATLKLAVKRAGPGGVSSRELLVIVA